MNNIPLSAMIGLFFTALYFLAAIFAPLIAPYGMSDVVSNEIWAPASSEFLLGTDSIGRDLLTRMIYGGRTTIFIATAATILSFVTGSVLGFFAAVSGGWIDQVLSRFVDLMMAIPSLILALVVLAVVPVTLPVIIVLMGLLDATRVFRLARAVAVDINVMDYVEAARLRGEGTSWVIFREILPNALSPLVAEMGLRFIFMVLFVSTLSFLGLGVQRPTASWGTMLSDGRDYIRNYPHISMAPGIAITLTVLAFNLIGDGLRDALDPRQRD